MRLAGYKTISILLLIVVVALAGGSPVFAQDNFEASISFDPPAACPGATVTIFANIPLRDVVGGGISVAAMSPLDGPIELSSDPGGLIANGGCSPVQAAALGNVKCAFVVSESASCGRYTVTVTLVVDTSNPSVSGPFDVAGPCCPAVGGCVQPVNTFALVSPYLAVIAVLGCIGTVVVVAKKRQP
jgi:hypothetical protein